MPSSVNASVDAQSAARPAVPAPRTGLQGVLDRFIGPGATPAEIFVQLVPSVLAAIAAYAYAVSLPIAWTPWQLGLIVIFGFDLAGGVLTLSLIHI